MTMELHVFKTLWGHTGDLEEAIAACLQNEFAGLEGQVPDSPAGRKKFRMKLAQNGLGFIAEICTAGCYVPRRQAALSEHLESLRCQAEVALECHPRFLTVIAG